MNRNESTDKGASCRAGGKSRLLAAAPAVAVALLPKAVCPACWPAYAGLLGSMGIGLVDFSPYLLPLTVVTLAAVISSLGYRAGSRRGFGPLLLGLLGAGAILLSKFLFASDLLLYGGIAFLIGASIWNSWPKRSGECPACIQAGKSTESPHTLERRQLP
ncbi:hypothetical protein [Desulfuromonas sp. DDH964]|uniref:hypothetical protein n=1 Tax=Desulfuromonas sp. DDH964 TaxID=1823759 RepID=UPI0012FAFB0B|nr:hypothetical protein [Desulfuromonas sp. DDH964]